MAITRKEKAISGEEIVPITREEIFLNAIATGDTSGLPEPITRMENLYKQAAVNSSYEDADGKEY